MLSGGIVREHDAHSAKASDILGRRAAQVNEGGWRGQLVRSVCFREGNSDAERSWFRFRIWQNSRPSFGVQNMGFLWRLLIGFLLGGLIFGPGKWAHFWGREVGNFCGSKARCRARSAACSQACGTASLRLSGRVCKSCPGLDVLRCSSR